MKGTPHLFITVSEIIPLPTLTLGFPQQKAQGTCAFFIIYLYTQPKSILEPTTTETTPAVAKTLLKFCFEFNRF